MKKSENKKGSDEDKAIAAVGSKNKIQTDEPLSEKDEVKQVEEEMIIRMSKKPKTK